MLITVSIPEKVLARIDKQAEGIGISRSEYLRSLALKDMEK